VVAPLRRIAWVVAVVALVLAGAGVALTLNAAPARAAEGYLAATYAGQRNFKDVRVETLERSLNDATVRITARFEVDPDYGAYDDAPSWHEYAGDLKLTRQGGRWTPEHGKVLSNGATVGVFNAFWIGTDPAQEKQRAASQTCQCVLSPDDTEAARDRLNTEDK
jgi:hypothetical protein